MVIPVITKMLRQSADDQGQGEHVEEEEEIEGDKKPEDAEDDVSEYGEVTDGQWED